ncbi:hypothetical protein M2163_005167 [Streptomyces sp. SAI-135]|nr:hypothetical protein [Streptomyces sp. SAI-090]MDH6618059.1 hypothetical protein [Streptomyces sp. SAI-135]
MGEVFAGRYELADPIGRGGVGAVWRAWDHRRRRYVAAKVLLQSDAHSLLRFVREQALRIDHPHVLAPASWAADDDKVLFTMDLVAGGSLVHLIGDYGPLPPAFVCTLLDQLLAGLAAVHAEGVVHRDIKPANILLEATGTARPRLRLSDFGIAMRLGEPRLTETNLVVGTPGYLAPEQMMGAEPDFPADLFAVGLVALYLLEGAKPDAKALIQYFAAHGTPGAPQSVPEPLWQVVASLLQPDPQARFRTATGARKALAAARELLPDPGPDDESIEIFDQLGPLPPGFGPQGPLKQAPGVDPNRTGNGGFGTSSRSGGSFGGGGGSGVPAGDGGGGSGVGAGEDGRGAFWRGGGQGDGVSGGAGTGSGVGAGAAGAFGDGAGSGGAAGGFGGGARSGGAAAGFGAGGESGAGEVGGAREVGGAPPWSGQGNGMAYRPPGEADEAGGAGGPASWFGEHLGGGSRPGEGGDAGAVSFPAAPAGGTPHPPEEPGGAPSRPSGGTGRFSHPGAPGEAPSWHSEVGGTNGAAYGHGEQSWPPHQPGEANGAAHHPGVPNRPPHVPGEPNSPVHRPGQTYGAEAPPDQGSGGNWPRQDRESSWPAQGNESSWRSQGNEPSQPGCGGVANSAPWSQEANQAPWLEQALPPSWPRETGPVPGAEASSPGTDHRTPWPAPTDPPSVPGTGSFPLPPPRPTGSPSQSPTPPQQPAQPPRPATPATPATHSGYAAPHDPTPSTHVLPSPQPHAPRFPAQTPAPAPNQLHGDASTASYTAQSPRVPPSAPPLSRSRRSGPPAKVAIPLLLLALACYAVGFWAFTQI